MATQDTQGTAEGGGTGGRYGATTNNNNNLYPRYDKDEGESSSREH